MMNFLRKKYAQVPICCLTICAFMIVQSSFAFAENQQEETSSNIMSRGANILLTLSEVVPDLIGDRNISGIGVRGGAARRVLGVFPDTTSVSDLADGVGIFASVFGGAAQWYEAQQDINSINTAFTNFQTAFQNVGDSQRLENTLNSAQAYAERVATIAYGTTYAAREGGKGVLIGGGLGMYVGFLVSGLGGHYAWTRRGWRGAKVGFIIGAAIGGYSMAKKGKEKGEEEARKDVRAVSGALISVLREQQRNYENRIAELEEVIPRPPRKPEDERNYPLPPSKPDIVEDSNVPLPPRKTADTEAIIAAKIRALGPERITPSPSATPKGFYRLAGELERKLGEQE